jgi:hypothetical protein
MGMKFLAIDPEDAVLIKEHIRENFTAGTSENPSR